MHTHTYTHMRVTDRMWGGEGIGGDRIMSALCLHCTMTRKRWGCHGPASILGMAGGLGWGCHGPLCQSWEWPGAVRLYQSWEWLGVSTDIVPFYIFVRNGVEIRDGDLSVTSNEAEFRYASIQH